MGMGWTLLVSVPLEDFIGTQFCGKNYVKEDCAG